MSDFSGFPAAGLNFLQQLPKRDKAWFQENRKIYDECIVVPSKAFVEALGANLCKSVSSAIIAVAKANGSMAPINNDVRFSKDKSAYKDHLLFRFWEGADKKTAATLFVRISATEIGFASGVAFSNVAHWRELIDRDKTGKPLATLIAQATEKRPIDVAGQELKKAPAPYPQDHVRAALLRHKMLQIRWAEALPKEIRTKKFADLCGARLAELADIHHWLVEHSPI
ncbi:MAG: hypothetical protein ACI9BW_004750 [Gammaproteobacteria bacterium]|jgi:uncharacterized protein (TIGR02453 family)